jgi:hypothetical protein
MRALAGPVLVHGALVAAGFGVLKALGVVPRLRSRRALAAAGLAYLIGIATTLSACVIVLVLGGPFDLPVFAVIAVACASPLVLRSSPLQLATAAPAAKAATAEPAGGRAARYATVALLTALAALALIGLLTVGNRPLGIVGADAWNQWTRKALLLVGSPHLPSAIFSFSGDFRYEPHYNINASYPLLLPLFEALHLRALGRADPSSVHVALWLLAIAFLWAGGFIASRVTSTIVWAPVLAGAVLLSLPRLMSGYADIPLGYYLALGTLALGVWLQSGQRRDLVVAVVLLGGAAGLKDEGTAGALVALAAALAVLLLSRARAHRARELALAAGLLLLMAVLPWRLWVAAHHLQTEDPLGRLLNPVFLVDHLGRVGPAMRALVGQLTPLSGVTAFASIALAMALASIVERRGRAIAWFYLAVGLGYFIALVWSYWISTLPLSYLLPHTAPRIVLALGLVCVAAVIQLSAPEGAALAEPGDGTSGP